MWDWSGIVFSFLEEGGSGVGTECWNNLRGINIEAEGFICESRELD